MDTKFFGRVTSADRRCAVRVAQALAVLGAALALFVFFDNTFTVIREVWEFFFPDELRLRMMSVEG